MKISGRWKYGKALILSKERMIELNAALMTFCERVEFTAETKQNRNIQFETLDEMLSFDNFAEKRLCEVEITGYIGFVRVFRLNMKDCRHQILHYYSTVECFYDFDTFDEETLFLSKLKDVLRKATSNYWFIGKFSFWGAMLICTLPYTIINILTGNLANVEMNSPLFSVIVSFGIVGIIWLFNYKFYYSIFPAVVFLWEEELGRYNKWQKLRSNIFWSVIIALIMGLIVAVIAKSILG